jgi:hypothetical protein
MKPRFVVVRGPKDPQGRATWAVRDTLTGTAVAGGLPKVDAVEEASRWNSRRRRRQQQSAERTEP